jgi:hypothetical protein
MVGFKEKVNWKYFNFITTTREHTLPANSCFFCKSQSKPEENAMEAYLCSPKLRITQPMEADLILPHIAH